MNSSGSTGNKSTNTGTLYLSAIDADYRVDRDHVLGPWCFIGNEDIAPQWESQTFLEAFESPESIAQASSDCSDLTAYLVAQWGEKLNERHGTNYETSFWSPLLTRWIFHSVGAAWRRWNLIQRFIEINQHEVIRVSVIAPAKDVKWNFAGLSEFVNLGLLSPEFDLWLYSLCLERLAPAHWKLEPIKNFSLTPHKAKKVFQPPANTNAIKRFGRKVLGRLPFGDILGVGPVGALIFSAWVSIIPKHTPAPYFFQDIDAPPARFPDAFLEVLDILLKNSILKCLSTDFHTFNEIAKRYRYVPGRLFVTGASHSNESVNFQTAHAIAHGEKVVRSQHGASYGTMAHGHCKKLTEYPMSGFLTWGWKKQNNNIGNFFPLPAPSLCRIRNRHRPSNKDIILVGTKTILRSQRVDYAPDPSYTPFYRKEKIRFISALHGSLIDNLLYRPYTRSDVELEDQAYVSRHFPTLKILEGSLEKAMLNCRLLVLDHPGTTLNIVMAANVPTICFWDPKVWPYSAEAAPYFEAMIKAGMIFPDGKSAARHINEISDNVQGWWLSDEVQSARQAWADQFAHTSRFWWWHWLKTLYRI